MKSKSIILLAVSLGFGLVAAFGISQVIGKSGGPAAAPVQRTTPVVIAKDKIEIDTLLTEENVQLVEWPEEMVPEDAVTSLEDLEKMVAKSPIYKDQPVMNDSIINEAEAGKIEIAPGHTIISINVSADDTNAGLLRPGDRVDLMAVFQGKDGGLKSAFTRTFLRKVKVFAIGQNTSAGERGEARGESIVSVEVTKKDAEKIVLVQRHADIKMTMVSNDDSEENEASNTGTDFSEVLYGKRGDPYDSLAKKQTPQGTRSGPNQELPLFPQEQRKQFISIHTSTGVVKYEWKDGENLPVLVTPTAPSQPAVSSPLSPPASSQGAPTSGNTGQSSPESKSGSAGEKSQDEFED